MDSLGETKEKLFQNLIVKEVVSGEEDIFANWCPNARSSPEKLEYLQDAMSYVETNTKDMVDLLNSNLPENENGFAVITQVTQYLDESISWFFDHDWILKLILMILNVLNFFMIGVCYFLSKNDVIHPPSRMYTTWILVPLFSIFTFVLLVLALMACAASPALGAGLMKPNDGSASCNRVSKTRTCWS